MAKRIVQEYQAKVLGAEEMVALGNKYDEIAKQMIKAGQASSLLSKELWTQVVVEERLNKTKKRTIAQDVGVVKGQEKKQSNIALQIELLKSLNNKVNISNDQAERTIKLQEESNRLAKDSNIIAGKNLRQNTANRHANTKALKESTKQTGLQAEILKEMGKETGNTGGAGTKLITIWGKIGGVFKKVLGVLFGVWEAFKKVTKMIQDTVVAYDALEYSMKTILQSSTKLITEMGYLNEITHAFGGTLINTSKSYIKFKQAADSANLTAHDTQGIFRSVAKAGAVMGLSNDALTGTMLALEQMLSKGKLSAEELRRQLGERLPGAYNIMARSIGVSSEALDDLLRKGEILSKDVLPDFARQLEKEYNLGLIDEVDKLGVTIDVMSQEWTNFGRVIFSSEKWIYKVIDTLYEKLGYIGERLAKMTRNNTETAEFDAAIEATKARAKHDKVFDETMKEARDKRAADNLKTTEDYKNGVISYKKYKGDILETNRKYQIHETEVWNTYAKMYMPAYKKQLTVVEDIEKQIFKIKKDYLGETEKAVVSSLEAELVILTRSKNNQVSVVLKAESTQLKKLDDLKKKHSDELFGVGNEPVGRHEQTKLGYAIAKDEEYQTTLNELEATRQVLRERQTLVSLKEGEITKQMEVYEKAKELSPSLKKAVESLEVDLAKESGALSVLEYIVEMKEKSLLLDNKASGTKVKSYFMEKQLTGEIEKRIALKKIELKFQQLLQDADFTSIKEKEKAYNRELQLFKELKAEEVIKEEQVRKNFVIKETERLDKALRKHAVYLSAKKNATITYINAEGKEVEVGLNTRKDYVTKLENDMAEWLIKKNSEVNDAILDLELETQQSITLMRISETNRMYELLLVERTNAFTNEQTMINNLLATEKLSWFAYNKEKYESEKRFRDRSLLDAIVHAKDLLDIAKSNGGEVGAGEIGMNTVDNDVASAEMNLADALIGDEEGNVDQDEVAELRKILAQKKILQEEYAQKIKDLNKGISDAEKATSDEAIRMAKEELELKIQGLEIIAAAVNGLNDLANAISENSLMRLDERHAKELQQHEENVFLAEGDEDRKKALERQKVIEDRRRAKEKKKLEIEAAKRNKANAIFQIGLSTAMAIMNAAATVPAPFTVGAMVLASIAGATQLAAAIAKPIPKLKEGRTGGEATLAIVGDGGKPEVIERTDGSLQMTPSKDTLTYLNKGDKVHKSIDAFNMSLGGKPATANDGLMIERAIIRGFKKAKIESNNNITTNLNLGDEMWRLAETQFN